MWLEDSRRYRLMPNRKVCKIICSRKINNRWSFRTLTFHLPFTRQIKKWTERSSTDRGYKVSNGVQIINLVLARDLRCLQGLQAKWMNWFLREYLRALCTCRIWTNYPPHFWPIREHQRSPRDTFMFILCTFPIYQTNLWRTLTQCRIIKFRMWKSLKLESKAKTFYRTLLHLGCCKYWFCTFKRDKQVRKKAKRVSFYR